MLYDRLVVVELDLIFLPIHSFSLSVGRYTANTHFYHLYSWKKDYGWIGLYR